LHEAKAGAAPSLLGIGKSIRDLREFYSSKPGGAGLADKLIKSNLTLVTGKTVGQALDAVVNPLAEGLKRAADLAEELGLVPQVPASPASFTSLTCLVLKQRQAFSEATSRTRSKRIVRDRSLPVFARNLE